MSDDDSTHDAPDVGTADPVALHGTTLLVTGGAGFIGSHVVRAAEAAGARVIVLDDVSTGHWSNLDGTAATRHDGSILDPDALARAMQGVDAVVHLAAMVSVPQSVAEPMRCHEINVIGTVRVLEAARAAGVRRLVFASSSALYGEAPNIPSRETDTVDCCSPYAASKAAGESFVAAYGRCYGLSTVSLRFFNVFGPRQDPNSPYAAAIAAFVRAVETDRSPTVYGDGGQTRDFVPVSNVADACVRAVALEDAVDAAVCNIGTGTRTSLLEVIELLGDVTDRAIPITHAPARVGDVRESGAAIDAARTLLGYEPTVSTRDGLAAMVAAASD